MTKEKTWEEAITNPKIVEWAWERLYALSEIDPCIDNYRVAMKRNSPQKRRYYKQCRQGCCGFFDVVEKCPIDKELYMLGFNYGH